MAALFRFDKKKGDEELDKKLEILKTKIMDLGWKENEIWQRKEYKKNMNDNEEKKILIEDIESGISIGRYSEKDISTPLKNMSVDELKTWMKKMDTTFEKYLASKIPRRETSGERKQRQADAADARTLYNPWGKGRDLAAPDVLRYFWKLNKIKLGKPLSGMWNPTQNSERDINDLFPLIWFDTEELWMEEEPGWFGGRRIESIEMNVKTMEDKLD